MPLAMLLPVAVHACMIHAPVLDGVSHACMQQTASSRFVLVCLVRCLLEASLSACPLAPCISYPLSLVTSRVFRATQSFQSKLMIDDVMDHLISRNATDAEARAALAFSSSNVLQFQHML